MSIGLDISQLQFSLQTICFSLLFPDNWITIHNRTDDDSDFQHCFDYYKYGFGDIGGSLWLGLEMLHNLTASCPAELEVTMETGGLAPVTGLAKYSTFSVGNADTVYTLSISGYDNTVSTAGDSLSINNNCKFSARGSYGVSLH